MSTMALSRSLDPTAELRMSSEAFYLEAVKHLEAVFEETDSLVGLQAILLFCYYSLLNPTRGSEWMWFVSHVRSSSSTFRIHRYLVLGRSGEPNGGRPWTAPRDLSVGQPDAARVGHEQEAVLLGLQFGSIVVSRVGKASKYS